MRTTQPPPPQAAGCRSRTSRPTTRRATTAGGAAPVRACVAAFKQRQHVVHARARASGQWRSWSSLLWWSLVAVTAVTVWFICGRGGGRPRLRTLLVIPAALPHVRLGCTRAPLPRVVVTVCAHALMHVCLHRGNALLCGPRHGRLLCLPRIGGSIRAADGRRRSDAGGSLLLWLLLLFVVVLTLVSGCRCCCSYCRDKTNASNNKNHTNKHQHHQQQLQRQQQQ